jgi:hypothetical protein
LITGRHAVMWIANLFDVKDVCVDKVEWHLFSFETPSLHLFLSLSNDFGPPIKVRVKGYFGDISVMTADREDIILCTIEKANVLLNNFIVR